MKKFNLKFILAFLLSCSLIISQGCTLHNEGGKKTDDLEPVTMDGFFLDTVCSISIYDKGEAGREIISQSFSKIQDYENQLSKTKEKSDISLINNGHSQWVQVHPETAEIIKKGVFYSRLSRGVFDISCGGLTDLWDFHIADDVTHKGGTVPEIEQIQEELAHVDYNNIKINEAKSSVKITDSKTKINLGGIAKGYIADKIADHVEGLGSKSAVINLGGNIVLVGGKYNGKTEENFKIGVKDPLSTNGELLGYVEGKNLSVVTSGTYERYFIVNGKKYHHILDTNSGMPCETDLIQVTIISPRGKSADSDAISTICLALGEKKGIDFIDKINSNENSNVYMAIFFNKDGSYKIAGKGYKFVKN